MITGSIFVVAAPSGAGKTSLVGALLESTQDLEVSVSHTTRAIRPGEQDGVDYYFTSEDNFQRMINEQAFLEYARVYDHYYGTSRHAVLDKLQQGYDVILEIDWQGARQIKQLYPTSVLIYIAPPSIAELEKRLHSRAQDDQTIINKRMQMAKDEISHFNEFDYLLINDNFDTALTDFQAIIRSQRLKLARQLAKYGNDIASLLG